jgi:GNAT superfamily N-acetyltransferase
MKGAGMEIRKITIEGLPAALDLVWNVFLGFEAPEYSQEGVDEFKRYIDQQAEELTLEVYGAFEQDELIGVIATKNGGSHISWFFVKKENHGQGIGRKLFEHILPLCDNCFLTVNSSPYAVKIYRKLGFADTAEEQLTNGIRYIPMQYTIGRNGG